MRYSIRLIKRMLLHSELLLIKRFVLLSFVLSYFHFVEFVFLIYLILGFQIKLLFFWIIGKLWRLNPLGPIKSLLWKFLRAHRFYTGKLWIFGQILIFKHDLLWNWDALMFYGILYYYVWVSFKSGLELCYYNPVILNIFSPGFELW